MSKRSARSVCSRRWRWGADSATGAVCFFLTFPWAMKTFGKELRVLLMALLRFTLSCWTRLSRSWESLWRYSACFSGFRRCSSNQGTDANLSGVIRGQEARVRVARFITLATHKTTNFRLHSDLGSGGVGPQINILYITKYRFKDFSVLLTGNSLLRSISKFHMIFGVLMETMMV